ncbi:hypothetical protein WALBB_70003 [Wolbachia pipientis wAlbB]|nr:hypothetical protein WALBB_70003 [Wolbachia pipientis wAlbB]
MFLMMEYVTEAISATVTVASRFIPIGPIIEAEDIQHGTESVVAAPMTHREVSTISTMFVF